ncbi:MAG: hypothetical protein AAF571_13370 [Verrucomicrobiota bacterium]
MSFLKKFLVALFVAISAAVLAWAAGKHYAESLPKLYRSQVTFSVREAADARKGLRGFSQTQQEDIEMRMLSQQIISDVVLDGVATLPEDRRALRQRIIVEPVKQTRLIQVKVDAREAAQAAVLANQVAESFAVYKKQEAQQLYWEALDLLEEEHQLNLQNYSESLQKQAAIPSEQFEATALQADVVKMHAGLVQVTQNRLDKMRAQQGYESVIQIVALAEPAVDSAYPNVVLIASFSAAGGALAGFALTVVFFALRRKR